MRLTDYQISKIEKTINPGVNKSIVLLDLSEDTKLPLSEVRSNIYCVDDNYEIIWQVSEKRTTFPLEDDLFMYLEKNEKDEIVAYRFSGFIYRIDPETGEAIQTGFCK